MVDGGVGLDGGRRVGEVLDEEGHEVIRDRRGRRYWMDV